MIDAFEGLLVSGLHIDQKFISDRSSGHTDGTFDYNGLALCQFPVSIAQKNGVWSVESRVC